MQPHKMIILVLQRAEIKGFTDLVIYSVQRATSTGGGNGGDRSGIRGQSGVKGQSGVRRAEETYKQIRDTRNHPNPKNHHPDIRDE